VPNPTNSAINLADDSRGVISNASNHLSTLLSLSSPPNQSPTKPSNASSSVTSQTTSSSATDVDNAMIETMSKLIRLTKRNMRVRYELAIVDVIQALVTFPTASLDCRIDVDLEQFLLWLMPAQSNAERLLIVSYGIGS
jgi:hypothetical protein